MTIADLIEKVKVSDDLPKELKVQLVEKIPYAPMSVLENLATMLTWNDGEDLMRQEQEAFVLTVADAFTAMNHQSTKEGVKAIYKCRRAQ